MNYEIVKNLILVNWFGFVFGILLYFTPSYGFGQIVGDSLAFALGLATTLALLGVAASYAGKAYGQVGQGLPLAASSLAVVMGLNLLEVSNNHITSHIRLVTLLVFE